jgi:hypothetical protein
LLSLQLVSRCYVAAAVRGAAVFREGRRFFRLLPDLREDANAGLEVVRRNIFYEFVAQPVRGVENFFEDSFRATLEMDDFAPPVVGRFSPLNPTILLEPVEQTGERWFFNAHALSDFLLREFVPTLGNVDERAPLALAQAERAETLIEFGAPGTSGAEEQKTELIRVSRWHGRKLVSVLTNAVSTELSNAA